MSQDIVLKLEDVQAGNISNDQFKHLTLKLEKTKILAVMSSRAYDLNNLIDLLNGALTIGAGRLFLYGREYPMKELKKFHIVFVTRRNMLFEYLTVAQNMFMHERCSKKKAKLLARRQLDEFNLNIDLDKNVTELTNGEQKIIEILRAYNCARDIVALYDSMNYVEKRFAPRMRFIFEKFKEKGKSIIYLTANLEDALTISDRICLLGGGRIETDYNTADIRKNPRELIYLMSGIENGHWDDSEGKLMLESIIEARDALTSNNKIKETLAMLAVNVARILNASSCVIYVNDIANLSLEDPICSDDGLLNGAYLSPDALREFRDEARAVCASDSPEAFMKYFTRRPPYDAFLTAPVIARGQCMAYIQVNYNERFKLTDEGNLYLSAFMREVALAIETSRLRGRSVLLQESHHRIKNSLQMIVNLLYMQRANLEPGQKFDFTSVINGIIYRIKSIALVHETLSGEGPRDSIINLQDMVSRIAKFYSMQDVSVDLDIEPISISYGKATSLALIVNELICNSVKHAFPDDFPNKRLRISLRRLEDSIQLVVQDNGKGFEPGFNVKKDMGLGMQIINIIAKEFEGSVRFEANEGTRAELTLPLSKVFEISNTGIELN